jgi:hypothetical protein
LLRRHFSVGQLPRGSPVLQHSSCLSFFRKVSVRSLILT